jgi:hypothetical protein
MWAIGSQNYWRVFEPSFFMQINTNKNVPDTILKTIIK